VAVVPGLAHVERDAFFVDGTWVEPRSTSRIEVVSPATERVIGSVPNAGAADIDAAVAAARRAFDHGEWPWLSIEERAEWMRKLAGALRERVEALAVTISSEMGSVISHTRLGQAPGPAAMLEFYADLASSIDVESEREGVRGRWTVLKQPVGVVGAIVPWNGPIFLAMYKLAPALLAGCTVVLKPAPESPLSGYLLAEAIEDCGLPAGVVNVLPGGTEAGQALARHASVDKVAFTGSTEVGRWIMAQAATSMKRVTLELGGKSAAILLDDADLEAALPSLVFGVLQNNGQVCASNSRLLVPRRRHDEVVEAVSSRFADVVVGDPLDERSVLGPLVSKRQRDRVLGMIDQARADGSSIACGGGRPAGLERGWYVEPTVVTGVDPRQQIARDEVFGPVLSVIAYDGEDEALTIANDSIYGLGAAIFSEDVARARALALRVRSGTVNINTHCIDYSMPFGGWKQSGIGREGGREAFENYVEIKVVGPEA
jgi:aldehyde dehydrogenase (NAD+)